MADLARVLSRQVLLAGLVIILAGCGPEKRHTLDASTPSKLSWTERKD